MNREGKEAEDFLGSAEGWITLSYTPDIGLEVTDTLLCGMFVCSLANRPSVGWL